MLEEIKNRVRGRARAFLAILFTLLAAVTGCDKKPEWRGVATDSQGKGQALNASTSPAESTHGQPR